MKRRYAVIGAGPLGSCAARALAESLDEASRNDEVLLIDANNPVQQRFDAMSAAGPHAAGQLMLHVFDPESSSKDLTRRSHDSLRQLNQAGHIDLHSRPWICCTGNSGSALDTAAQEVLAQSFNEGRFEGCALVRGEHLPETPGLRNDQIAWALTDPTTMAVNPRVFVQQLAEHAVRHRLVQPMFETRVLRCEGNQIEMSQAGTTRSLDVDGVIVCSGIHRDLYTDRLPASRPEYLHVIEHHNVGHDPEVMNLITGETTIARYSGFGNHREAIRELLPRDVYELGIHGLFTDVPGLRRMLDSHFEDEAVADRANDQVWRLLRETIGRYVEPEFLLGEAESNRNANKAYVAAYTKLLADDGPCVAHVKADIPVVYVQPSNGLGLNQCAALGRDAMGMFWALIR